MSARCRIALTLVTCLGLSLAVARGAAAQPLPGRVLAVSLGGSYNPSLGGATRKPPDLLRTMPELQIAWGMQIAERLLLRTRLDLLGGLVPLLPSGAGVDLDLAWAPGLARPGWGPLVRFGGGGLFFASGGQELTLGPDYQAGGFRLALEAGLLRRVPAAAGAFTWGVTAGVHAVGLVHIEPCRAGDDCSDAFIGPSLRVEGSWLF